jgi:hypothetical protein
VTLLEGERVIDRLDNYGVILTTHRIREGTDRDFTSIMLEQVCSIAVERVAKTWLLVAGVALIVGVTIMAEYHRIGLDAAAQVSASGLFFILCYFLTRFSVVQIASGSARISLRLPRRKRKAESVLRLIDAIEYAKSERTNVLSERQWERAS